MDEKQEKLMKLQMLEQQAAQFAEQIRVVDQQTIELRKLKDDISELEKANEGEMFSEFGKGIFVKSTLKKELMVDVGNKILVPKSFKEVGEIIDSQIGKFNEIKPEIAKNIESINHELDHIMQEEASSEKKGK